MLGGQEDRRRRLRHADITAEIVPGIEFEKMGFAVRKTDRALLQVLNQQLAATAAGRDGVLSKLIPGWGN